MAIIRNSTFWPKMWPKKRGSPILDFELILILLLYVYVCVFLFFLFFLNFSFLSNFISQRPDSSGICFFSVTGLLLRSLSFIHSFSPHFISLCEHIIIYPVASRCLIHLGVVFFVFVISFLFHFHLTAFEIK